MAASLLGSASSWALARLLKVALKRNLKHVFATEIDVDQLEVGGGALALRELVLSLDWLNAQLAGSDWEATAGFVGSVVLRLPLASLASLSCQVELSDVLLTLRPSAATPAPAWPASAAAAAGPGDGAAWPAAEPGQQDVAVAEGIRIVAAGLEAMLHRLRASISRLAVRLEVPLAAGSGSGGDGGGPTAVHVATLQLDQLDYRPAAEAEEGVGSGTEPDGGGVRVHKSIAFSGLTLQLQPAAATVAGAATLAAEPLPPVLSGKGGGATGALGVEVAWQLDGSCSVAATADLEPLHLQLWPAHLAALASMAVALRQQPAAEAVAAAAARQPPAAMALAAPPHSTLAKVPWGAQSLLDSLLLPDCERVVSESLYSGQEEVDEFFDARSVLGSLQSSFSEQGLAASAHQAHTLAVSVHRAHPSAPAQHWSLYLRAPELSASLLYPAAGPGLCFQPQLVVEVCGLDLEARHGGSGSSNGGPGALEVAFFAQQLEASEYLPCPRGSAAGAGAQLPEEMGCVPEVLPRLARGRALPTASGDYPLPGSRGGLGGDSSSMAHSAVECSMANTVYESTQCDSGVVPRVQVVPVFACGRTATGDGDGGLSLLASLPLPGSGSPSIAAVLPPITLWLAQPLADRLQGLAADVLARFEAAAKVQQQLQQDAGWQPAATAADERRVSIDEILQELHEIQDMGRCVAVFLCFVNDLWAIYALCVCICLPWFLSVCCPRRRRPAP